MKPITISNWFTERKPIIGMVHVLALPGTPHYGGAIREIVKRAVEEALLYEEAGLDGIAIENMHDIPYLKRGHGPEITATMTAVAMAIRAETRMPMGIQILAGANTAALAVALAGDLQFVRAEGFVFGHLADEGYIDSCAGELLRYRKSLGAERIQIWTDIKKKHSSHALTADLSINEIAKAAAFFHSDALIVTGTATGEEALPGDLGAAKVDSSLPVLAGSGVTSLSLPRQWPMADGFIVGSYFKVGGHWSNPVDPQRLRRFMESVETLRKGE